MAFEKKPSLKTDRKSLQRQRNFADILQAASKLVLERGLENTSMDDIAEATSYSKGSLYNYFKNKDDLVTELTRSIFSEFKTDLEPLLANQSISIRTKIEQVLDYATTTHADRPGILDLVDQIINQRCTAALCHPDDPKHIVIHDFLNIFVDLFKKEMENKKIRQTDPFRLSVSFLNLVIFLFKIDKTDQEFIDPKISKSQFILDLLFEKL